MTDIYFVRHGETGGNVAKRHQRETTHLTARGKQQAATVAAQLARVQPTHLFVSQRVRALETGLAIANETNLIPETSTLFVEVCRPTSMYGHKHRSVKTVRYLWQWWRGKIGGTDCGTAGESYAALRERLKDAKTYLATLPADSRVVVVSHAVFIQMFKSHLHDSTPLSFFEAVRAFWGIRRLKNASVTHVRYADGTWELINSEFPQ